MREISIFRARPIGEVPVPDVRITIKDAIEESGSLDCARSLYRAQGEQLADAFMRSLPGGTVDALVLALLERKVSLFRVPFQEGSYLDNRRRVRVLRDICDGNVVWIKASEICVLHEENAYGAPHVSIVTTPRGAMVMVGNDDWIEEPSL